MLLQVQENLEKAILLNAAFGNSIMEREGIFISFSKELPFQLSVKINLYREGRMKKSFIKLDKLHILSLEIYSYTYH